MFCTRRLLSELEVNRPGQRWETCSLMEWQSLEFSTEEDSVIKFKKEMYQSLHTGIEEWGFSARMWRENKRSAMNNRAVIEGTNGLPRFLLFLFYRWHSPWTNTVSSLSLPLHYFCGQCCHDHIPIAKTLHSFNQWQHLWWRLTCSTQYDNYVVNLVNKGLIQSWGAEPTPPQIASEGQAGIINIIFCLIRAELKA